MVKLNCTTISDYIIKNADVENLTIPKKML